MVRINTRDMGQLLARRSLLKMAMGAAFAVIGSGMLLPSLTQAQPPASQRPAPPTRTALFYNASTGAGATGNIDEAGNYVQQKGYTTFSNGWTRIAAAQDRFLFYNAYTGAGATGKIDEAGNYVELKSYTNFSRGWTYILFDK